MNWIAVLILAALTTGSDPGGTTADIVNSGSTNTLGYVLHLHRTGSVVVDAKDGTALHDAAVAPDLIKRFFAALDASKPLGSMPVGRCAKSKSFGHSIQVLYKESVSPDLTCPFGAEEAELASLASEIARAAHVSDRTRRHAPAP
jgi:hypothetical protein